MKGMVDVRVSSVQNTTWACVSRDSLFNEKDRHIHRQAHVGAMRDVRGCSYWHLTNDVVLRHSQFQMEYVLQETGLVLLKKSRRGRSKEWHRMTGRWSPFILTARVTTNQSLK